MGIGEVIGLIGISTDITELKQTQGQLRNTNKRAQNIFQGVIDSLPVLLFWTDKQQKIIGNNLPHAKAFGFYNIQEMIGRSVSDFSKKVGLDSSIVAKVQADHHEIISTKQGKAIEYTAKLSDDKEKTWLSQKEPLLNENGQAIGVIGISMDISELKDTQKNWRDPMRSSRNLLRI